MIPEELGILPPDQYAMPNDYEYDLMVDDWLASLDDEGNKHDTD